MSIKYGAHSLFLAAALTASTTHAAGFDAPQDSFSDWYVIDDTYKICANVNPKAVRDWNLSQHSKMFDYMVKTEPSTPDMQIAAWKAQGKEVHTILVVNPSDVDMSTLLPGKVIFEIVYYKGSQDKDIRRVFFLDESICKYVTSHSALPNNISEVVMTIDGDKANAVRMSRQDFDRNVIEKSR